MSGLIRIAQQERERRKNNNTQWDQHEPIVRGEMSEWYTQKLIEMHPTFSPDEIEALSRERTEIAIARGRRHYGI
jgi:hypothetical protein